MSRYWEDSLNKERGASTDGFFLDDFLLRAELFDTDDFFLRIDPPDFELYLLSFVLNTSMGDFDLLA